MMPLVALLMVGAFGAAMAGLLLSASAAGRPGFVAGLANGISLSMAFWAAALLTIEWALS